MQVKFALEPYPGATEIPPPAPDYRPTTPRAEQVTIGRSNIREAGRPELRAICAAHGWDFNDSADWLSEDAEVERLARSWVNVVWYTESRSRGSAAMMAAASRRPLLLNRESGRFWHLAPYADEIYFRPLKDLEQALVEIVEDVSWGQAKRPERVVADFSWRKAARTMIAVWKAALRA
jgi:hypothetical protein